MVDDDNSMATIVPTNHGLECPPELVELVDSLPILCKSTSQCPPVRALPPQVFSALHLSHILSHPPDNVLFPFLHGIEGENEAQNTFFSGHNVRVPKYRGLVWVACEEDLEADERQYGRSLAILRRRKETIVEDSESESDSSDFDDDEDDEVQDESYLLGPKVDVMPMDIDSEADGPQEGIHVVLEDNKEKEKHMHPVVQRPTPIQIQTTNLSSFSSSSADTDLSTSLTTDASTNDEFPPTPSLGTITSASSNSNPQFPKVKRDKELSDLVLLTSSFRPNELIRGVPTEHSTTSAHGNDASGWEFIPARVPDGISLRNFGIQVPIYATLSDIVVYSPKGPSPNAIALAQRLQEAIGKKREERAQSKSGFATSEEQEAHLFKYNVFVLDADEEAMKKELPHLLMRVCKNGVPGGSGTSFEIGAGGGAHTDGPDGHVFDMSEMEVDVEPKEEDPNTVDFAQREKEEMRDLTKASEIISIFPPGVPPVPDLSNTTVHWDPLIGQVFLGNADDVPLAPDLPSRFRHAGADPHHHQNHSESDSMADEDPFNYLATNGPSQGYGYDICVECHDLAPFPTAAHLRAAEEHLGTLDVMWAEKHLKRREEEGEQGDGEYVIPPRPPPNANAVIHLPFPSSPSNGHPTMSALLPVIRFLEKWLKPVVRPPPAPKAPPPPAPAPSNPTPVPSNAGSSSARRWSSVSSLMPSFPAFPSISSSTPASPSIPPSPTLTTIPAGRTRSFTSPAPYLSPPPPAPIAPSSPRTRPLKVLIYSSDGYTESSVPALCLLMAVRELTLPEAYLELQVAKRRSFFVYQGDLGVLRRVEGRLREDRERERERQRHMLMMSNTSETSIGAAINVNGKRAAAGLGPGRQGSWSAGPGPATPGSEPAPTTSVTTGNNSEGDDTAFAGQGISTNQNPYARTPPPAYTQPKGRPAAKSVSFAHVPIIQLPTPKSPPIVVSSQGAPINQIESSSAPQVQPSSAPDSQVSQIKGRPRASTSPWLPSLFGGDHQSWFNDPRFDGSFPSRVLPFLYLGNLNHATNVFMLHALGITHVVSVGECALIPPPHHIHGHAQGYMASSPFHRPAHGAHYVPGKGSSGQGSLWFEEREGRIKVMDIKGVCDDGIDTLEPQLEPICDWIDQARAEGGQVLVHCRVGVSRSATVTIAYVMKHLGLPLVDAYLIVRSRRLSVLIQPNMRLLYNLCGWEIKLAKERAGENEAKLRKELARTLSWPYLAKEVHALNLKYLH